MVPEWTTKEGIEIQNSRLGTQRVIEYSGFPALDRTEKLRIPISSALDHLIGWLTDSVHLWKPSRRLLGLIAMLICTHGGQPWTERLTDILRQKSGNLHLLPL